MALRALIADDHELFRSGLKQLLVDALGVEDVREAETFDQAIEILTDEGAGDLVLVDLRMPGMSGAEALAALRDGFPNAKIVVVSAWEERAEILAALSAGVHGYIPKSLSAAEIAAALRSVLDGRIYVPATIGRRDPGDPVAAGNSAAHGESKLTLRQKEVLNELLKGQASKEIARTLDIAEGTVKIHLAAIYRALGVRTRAEAIARLKT
ncbi:response regulator transcription factor [Terricaulis sp.]|jgi:DNA-binding NarL/FixJ family response regulator|uniref:response regulator transcription factor n=1 Tax=Terricaulis sp. TaxID=2768686 RepID=UPI002AC40980|nr:response regulator transcription factor [Terricaulis sp.]MDZ4693161.1 response regulator transcription factor [Terricaulis sp.]